MPQNLMPENIDCAVAWLTIPVRRDIAPGWHRSPANADFASLECDNVAGLQLPSAAAINLAVHGHVAVDDGFFHVSTGVEEPSELYELPEANDLTTDRDVVDRGRVRHAEMLGHCVPAADLSSLSRGSVGPAGPCSLQE